MESMNRESVSVGVLKYYIYVGSSFSSSSLPGENGVCVALYAAGMCALS